MYTYNTYVHRLTIIFVASYPNTCNCSNYNIILTWMLHNIEGTITIYCSILYIKRKTFKGEIKLSQISLFCTYVYVSTKVLNVHDCLEGSVDSSQYERGIHKSFLQKISFSTNLWEFLPRKIPAIRYNIIINDTSTIILISAAIRSLLLSRCKLHNHNWGRRRVIDFAW